MTAAAVHTLPLLDDPVIMELLQRLQGTYAYVHVGRIIRCAQRFSPMCSTICLHEKAAFSSADKGMVAHCQASLHRVHAYMNTVAGELSARDDEMMYTQTGWRMCLSSSR